MKRFNHALTIAYSVDSDEEEIPTLKECLQGLLVRIAEILTADPGEQEEMLRGELPFDSYENEEVN